MTEDNIAGEEQKKEVEDEIIVAWRPKNDRERKKELCQQTRKNKDHLTNVAFHALHLDEVIWFHYGGNCFTKQSKNLAFTIGGRRRKFTNWLEQRKEIS